MTSSVSGKVRVFMCVWESSSIDTLIITSVREEGQPLASRSGRLTPEKNSSISKYPSHRILGGSRAWTLSIRDKPPAAAAAATAGNRATIPRFSIL